jgi:hypothetical protein
LRLESFRIRDCFGFADSGEIILGAPGNLVYFLGRNSSAKTSVLRSICHFEYAEVSEGDGDGGVPQQLLNEFRVDVPLE